MYYLLDQDNPEGLPSNVATIRGASHYVAVDFPSLVLRTRLKYLVTITMNCLLNRSKLKCLIQLSVVSWAKPCLGPITTEEAVEQGEFRWANFIQFLPKVYHVIFLSADLLDAFFGAGTPWVGSGNRCLKEVVLGHDLIWGTDYYRGKKSSSASGFVAMRKVGLAAVSALLASLVWGLVVIAA